MVLFIYQNEFTAGVLRCVLFRFFVVLKCSKQGIVCIPMGMSYALLANLPPVYGLYTSLVPPVMYLLSGTCDQLSLGVRTIDAQCSMVHAA